MTMRPENEGSPPLTDWRWSWRETVKHQFFDFLLLVDLRDRLRCPKCKAVGTWKPHGGWCDNISGWWQDHAARLRPGVIYATSRRWVCKYCGYIRDDHGERQGYPNKVKGVWDAQCANSSPTPYERVNGEGDKVWPWRG